MEKEALKILLADDDESDRLLFKDAFKELKLKLGIHMVKNGVQLMDYLIKNEDDLPHLIFLDLNMPRKNGLECLTEIRNNPKYKIKPTICEQTFVHCPKSIRCASFVFQIK